MPNRAERRGAKAPVRPARGTGERASAAVEFALVLPLVLTMVLALVQVGLLVKDQLVVAGSARAGARQAAVSTDDGSVRDAAMEAAPSLDHERLEVAVEREGGVGTAVRVSIAYEAPIVIPIVRWLFPESVRLSSAATMRQEDG